MDNIRKKYRVFIFIKILIMGIIISMIYLYAMKNMGAIYEQYAKESIIDLKKSFLKDNVNNLISSINHMRKEESEYHKNLTEDISNILEEYFQFSPSSFLKLSMNFFELKALYTVIITDKSSNILYDKNTFDSDKISNYPERIEYLKGKLSSYSYKEYGNYNVFWGVSKEYIEDVVKKRIYSEIHNANYSNDAYIWVNEIINYEGGDNYAIRRVHPNLIRTEGIFLSTNMKDIKGNRPYLTELKGVKKDGEIFFNYFFKKSNSDEISEKLTYAKLYKDYNWVIAMGVHLDEIQAYINKTTEESQRNITNMAVHIALWIIVLLITIYIFLALLERWYYRNSNRRLKEEVNLDPLTRVYNRRAAMIFINSSFSNYKKTGTSPALIMIDVDDFKKVNDTYGHDAGDKVLINISEIITNNIRKTDILCRWGGEEFLLICNGLKPEDIDIFSKKLLNAVAQAEYKYNEEKYNVTISMGISYFDNTDKDSFDSLKRADVSLYNAKNKGKNSASFIINQ